MNQLIPINPRTINNQTIQTVSARDLHSFLEIKKDFSTWVKDQVARARLVDGRDFTKVQEVPPNGGVEGNQGVKIEYFLTLDAGKHVGMISNTEKGFEIRDYFIECERVAKQVTPPRQLSRLEIAEQLVDSLKREEQLLLENTLKQQKIEEDAPKITIYNQVMDSTSEYSFSEVSGFIDCLEEELTMCCKHAGWLQSKSIKRIATFKGKHEGWLVPKAGKEGGVAMFTAKGVERVIIGIERMQTNSPLVYDKIFGASKAYGRKFKLEEKRKYEALVAYVTKKREDEAKKGAKKGATK